MPYTEELISRLFVDENWFRLMLLNRLSAKNAIGYFVLHSHLLLFHLPQCSTGSSAQWVLSNGFVPKRPIWISHHFKFGISFVILLNCSVPSYCNQQCWWDCFPLFDANFQEGWYKNGQYGFIINAILHFFFNCLHMVDLCIRKLMVRLLFSLSKINICNVVMFSEN